MGGGNPIKRVGAELGRWGRQVDPTSSESIGGDFGASIGLKGEDPNSPEAAQLTGLSKALFAETDPLRRSLIERSESFLGGNLDVTQSPQYAALKQGAESQYGRARRNILASTPTGGALTSALTQADLAKAGTLTSGIGALAGDEMNRALGLATGSPLTAAFGGLGQAGSIQAQLAQAQAAENAGTKQALGSGAALIALA